MSPSKEMVVYVQGGQNVTVDLSSGTGSYAARFYNPESGSVALQTTVTGGSPKTMLAAPASGDWVVHVRVAP